MRDARFFRKYSFAYARRPLFGTDLVRIAARGQAPRFYHANVCAQVWHFIALVFKTLAPAVQIGRLKK